MSLNIHQSHLMKEVQELRMNDDDEAADDLMQVSVWMEN